MGIVQMNNNSPVANGLVELNTHIHDEHKKIRGRVMGEEQSLSVEDESWINEDAEDRNDGKTELVQVQVPVQGVQQTSQQQPQGPLVRWERFLPLRSLKVLLVENDDSTRHVVCALLRNCGFEVTAVSNGLQAWKILEDLTNHIDLVLTEVVMPCLSGIGLLCKIMCHKTRKNIPVIIFRCLSKGAVDFLVKPIRKNELKNLWQHVWRKCHSSSGSGSQSGIQTQKSSKSKGTDSDNNTGRDKDDDNGSVGLNVQDGSDNGSGTQSSWTKRAVEVDSSQPISPWHQFADPPDSTCAQVVHSRPEVLGDSWVPVTATREYDKQDNELENVVMGKDLEIGVPKITALQLEDPSEEVLTNIAGANKDKLSAINPKKDDEKLEKAQLELNSEKSGGDLRNQAADLIGVITNNTEPQIESTVFDIPNGLPKVSDTKDKVNYDMKEMPFLELSLKRLRDVGDTGTSAHERNVLRHSDLSAFSRYNSGSTANQASTGNVGSCSPLDNSSEAAKTDSMKNFQSTSNSMPPKQQSNGSSNNNDMGSTTNNAFSKPAVLSDKPAPKTSAKSFHPSSAFQPVQSGCGSSPQPVAQGKGDAALGSMILVKGRGTDQQVKVRHHYHHYHHHHHHHVHNMPQNQRLGNHDDLSLENMAVAAPQCGSSNLSSLPHVEGNAANHSLTRSASGSNHGSNGQKESSTVLNSRGMNLESENGVPGKGGAGGGIGSGGRNGIDQNRFAQREAALNKFRQKRKERCFEKKVRYQSRKKLAEQRPRVRGQFVRQVHENKNRDTNC
ncbi:two-component response regulator-like PRR37 isoform X2 [Herrania umbratica]|uniref:Two-component response regulator-like PRR37 isoform X2 n=1 Tax=Herrania umbratica TaxID=108875 RepID=A0A6J1B9J3_9ROSI|nr:two-component response regulator-like PRR37 isoform X2 [Herrania umbratica]